jgi:hypothetical protein
VPRIRKRAANEKRVFNFMKRQLAGKGILNQWGIGEKVVELKRG